MEIESLPDDLVLEVLCSEDFIQHYFHVVPNVPIHVNINAPGIAQQFTEQDGGFVKPLEVGVESASPSVAIRLLLDDARLLGEGERVVFGRVRVIRHGGGEGEIRAGVERRVDVNQVHLAGELRQERGQHVFLVAPDEPVAPRRLFRDASREQRQRLAIRRALVHRLDGLERQCDAHRRDALAGGIVFAFPDQLGALDGEGMGGVGRSSFVRHGLNCSRGPQSGPGRRDAVPADGSVHRRVRPP